MIDIYSVANKDYNHNGDMILQPTYCKVARKLNIADQEALFTVELEHLYDREGRWKYILPNSVVKVPTPAGKQLFRIYKTEKGINSIVAYAKHVFWDLENKINTKADITSHSVALDTIFSDLLNGTGFNYIFIPSTAGSETFTMKKNQFSNVKDILLGKTSTGFKKRVDIDFDNFTIKAIYKDETGMQIGADNGFRADFGYNLKDIQETIDYSDLVTRIVAYCTKKDGSQVITNVDSPYINNYGGRIYERAIDYSESASINVDEGSPNSAYIAELIDDGKYDFDHQEFDKPTVNYKIDIANLRDTTAYRHYRQLEGLQIGDTVHCRHIELNITTASRMIAYEYDALIEKYISQELGDFIPNFFQLMKK